MKVLYILNAAFMGGATISFINMIEGLMVKGIIPIVVIPRWEIRDKVFMDYLESHHINYYEAFLTMSALHRPTNLLTSLRLCISCCSMMMKKLLSFYELMRIVEREKPNIIHTNTGVIREGLYVARIKGIPHVMHLREYQDLDFNWLIFPSKSYFEKKITHSDYIITITEGIREHFHLNGKTNAITIYNGMFSRHDIHYNPNKQKYFLCASRIIPEKGHKDVITAFAKFYKSHQEYNLLIAGFGDDTFIEELKHFSLSQGCAEAVEFIGYQKDVRPLMINATALVVASYYEGFGRMTAEAWFNGCIVIGRNTAGTKEILDITGGYKFDNVSELYASMEKIISLPEADYQQQVLLGQAKAADRFSNETNVSQIYSLYINLQQRNK